MPVRLAIPSSTNLSRSEKNVNQAPDIYTMAQEQHKRAWQQLTSFDAAGPGTLRQILTEHITVLVTANNDEAVASLDYLQTGVESPKVAARLPYIAGLRNKGDERRLQEALRSIKGQIIALPDLGGMDDSEFAQAYTVLLLKIRTRLLPDADWA